MTTFVFVHGAWHGAWCWDLLQPELVQRGHDVVTMDLPCDDPDATLETYADVVCAAMDRRGDSDAVVVGHSLAGLTVPLVSARRPLRRLVYLCALIPEPGLTFVEQNRGGVIVAPAALTGLGDVDERGCKSWLDPDLTGCRSCQGFVWTSCIGIRGPGVVVVRRCRRLRLVRSGAGCPR